MTSNIALPCIQNNCGATRIYTEQRLSIVSIVCRICYDNEKEEPLITPCRCKGTVAFVHKSCLETWLAESNTTTCELCHQIFKTERTPKYSSLKSIWRWVRIAPADQRGARGVKSDLLACGLLTPIAIIITYICLFSSDYYNQKKFSTIPAARWTSLSLLFMIAIMLIGYYLWVYSVIRLHARMWYNWWQRECVVKYVPPSTINICPNCPSSLHTPNNTPLSRTSSAENITGPRSHSVFQLEETEICHERLDRITDSKQRASMISGDDISVDIEEEVPPVDDKLKDSGPLTLIQNKGVIHILNFSDPSDMSNSLYERLNAHPFSNISSVSSDTSNLTETSSDEKLVADSKSCNGNENFMAHANTRDSGDLSHELSDCIGSTENIAKQTVNSHDDSQVSNANLCGKQITIKPQNSLPLDVHSHVDENELASTSKPTRSPKRLSNTSNKDESSAESEDM